MEGVTCRYGGKCKQVGEKEECVCPASCQPTRHQVCGSDQATYQSPCHVQQSACRLQRDLHVLYDGPCVQGMLCENSIASVVDMGYVINR